MSVFRLIRIIVTVLIVAGIGGFLIWAHIVSSADAATYDRVRTDSALKVSETAHSIIIRPANYQSTMGLIFIPGAKVDPHAYAYKLSGLSESLGVTVVITKPYLNLPIVDRRPLSTFTNDAPDVGGWIVGGHSLGGIRACSYAADRRNELKGLLLLASYCQEPVPITALTLRGKYDGLVSDADIRDNESQLTGEHQYYEINGANHASFGDYGMQSGDGAASIASSDMRDEITGDVAGWLPR